ncbi:dipeptidyl aminopeptidase 1, putative [Plasmodium malariae]|uniref:dipeptidyl-peptidase I n=1 Tax=Plasmodium malariae TaxID=5858 RepID=A0A1C3KCG4_PLAMA|nr:dipeptidyl aminopeptidase 1, putative [Plasmodium malariae]
MQRGRGIFIFAIILLHIFFVHLTLADLPIHVEIKDLIGKWKIYKTNTSPTITTCGSTQPNSNLYNINIKDYKKYLIDNHYRFESEMYVILSDDFVRYGDYYDTKENEHRKNWNVLAVYDEHKRVIGTWTTICDEGFEIRLGKETYTAIMHYDPSGYCSELRDDDETDANGETDCYNTNFNKIRYGWLDVLNPNNERVYGCFYAERYRPHTDSVNEEGGQNSSNDNSTFVTTNKVQLSPSFTSGVSIHAVLNAHNAQYTTSSANLVPPTFTKRKHTTYNVNSELYWHKLKHSAKKKPLSKLLNFNEQQKYACPCNADEQVQDVVNSGSSNNPVSPNFLQVGNKSDINLNNKSNDNDEGTNELDLESYEDVEKSPHRELEIDELPKNFTWGDPFNNNTREYEVINQLQCGSCYIASEMYVFKRRIEIGLTKNVDKKYLNDFDDVLSMQTVLSCSFYDQGCNGGYPFLLAKFAKLQGIQLNKVFPYMGKNEMCPYNVVKDVLGLYNGNKHGNETAESIGNIKMTNKLREIKSIFNENGEYDMHERFDYLSSADPEKWYIKDYNYIGGCYGCNQCNGEKIMMNEIYKNGPIVASFEASPDFYDYADGVYYVKDFPHAKRCTINFSNDRNSGNNKNNNVVYNITGWEKVNHAIVIVGWGEEEINGKLYKFWIGRNSWGRNWGKDGYFKIIRGVNFSGIESQSLFIEPDFTRGAGKILLEKLKNA